MMIWGDWPCSDVQLTPVDDPGQLKEDGEPALDPDTVIFCHLQLLVTYVVTEHLQEGMARQQVKIYFNP